MKNNILAISAFLLTLMLACGCDMFRSLAGRPTSEDIAAMRVELAARQAAEAAHRDSLEKARLKAEHEARIAAALDTLDSMKGYLRTPARFGGVVPGMEPRSRYSIVVGSYRDRDNAVKYSEKLTRDGFPAEAVGLRNGYTAVGVCPTDDPSELLASLRKVRRESFCPKEVWILVNE